jgi:hypothetical protein
MPIGTKQCPACNEIIGRTNRTCPKCQQPCTKLKPLPDKVRGFKAEARAHKRIARSSHTHTPGIAHVLTALSVFCETIDVDSLDTMPRLALQAVREAIALAEGNSHAA